MSVLLFVLGIVLFIGLVVVHEWGHFIVARRNGVEAEEFSIFFGPKLFQKRVKPKKSYKNGKLKPAAAAQPYLFSFRLLPLGGYVKMKGEHDSDTAKGSFGAASTWSKTKIMAAGVVMNFVVAYLLLILVALVGMPKLVPNQYTVQSDTSIYKNEVFVGYIEPGSPAAKAGLQSSDFLVGYKASPRGQLHQIGRAAGLSPVTGKYAGKKIILVYKRSGNLRRAPINLRSDAQVKRLSKKAGHNVGHLGVSPTELTLQRSTWSAPIVAGGLMGQFTYLTFQGLGKALAGLGGIIAGFVTGNSQARQAAQTEASSQVAGPIGIFYILKSGTFLGYQYVLFVIAVISLTLAIMNILPIPALDGGRLWLSLGFRAARKELTAKTEEVINATGFLILICLIILVSVVDVNRFF